MGWENDDPRALLKEKVKVDTKDPAK